MLPKTHILGRSFVLPALLLAMLACKGEDELEQSPTTHIEGPDTTFNRVMVDRLRMRSAPDMEAETIMLLPEGSIVKFWGERSQEQLEVILRGQSITDHWKRIKYGSSVGWIFGGAMQEIEDSNVGDLLIIPGERVGPVLATDNERSLIERLGPEHVERGDLMIGEGQIVEATYLFSGTEKELILLWDAEDFEHLREVRITKANSPWKTEEGLSVGTDLKTLEGINGKPFVISGFQWDYAGSTVSWNAGKVSSDLVIVFAEPKQIHKSLIGDHRISSDTRQLQRANPQVKAIRVLFSI